MTGVVEATPDDMTLAQAVLAATRGVPGVAGISHGRNAIARTLWPRGMIVEGIQLTPEPDGLQMEVHVVVRRMPFPPLAEAVRAADATTLRRLGAPATVVDVWVDNLRLSAAARRTPLHAGQADGVGVPAPPSAASGPLWTVDAVYIPSSGLRSVPSAAAAARRPSSGPIAASGRV